MPRLRQSISILAALLLTRLTLLAGLPPVMPLEAIEPGMTGEWSTVVSGVTTERFRFEVIGVAPHFVGPQQSIILARALDPSQIVSGPVAGMSGSPCYIDGQLIGAYAYGFAWPKEQAIIGITPIQDMLAVLNFEDQANITHRAPPGAQGVDSTAWKNRLQAWSERLDPAPLLLQVDPHRTHAPGLIEGLSPLPTPIFGSGLSGRSMQPFQAAFNALGTELMQAPIGHNATLGPESIQPGTAMAAVLMSGDFPIAAVGTVTWREGDQVLGFGHPFLGTGTIAVPMAPAEILTVIQSIRLSFKLSNVGPIIGSLQQDRLTAVAGKLGAEAPTTRVSYQIKGPHDGQRTFGGQLFHHQRISPMLGAITLLESLDRTLQRIDQRTLRYHATIQLPDREPLVIETVASSSNPSVELAMRQWLLFSLLADNPFEEVVMDSLEVEVTVEPGRSEATLEGVQMLSGHPEVGKDLRLALTTRNFQGQPERQLVNIPIPDGVEGQELTLLIGDGSAAERILRGPSANAIQSLDDLLAYLRKSRPDDRAYLMLMRPAEGLRLPGGELPALPPSMRLLLDNPRTQSTRTTDRWEILWQSDIPFPGTFKGAHTLPITVR